MNCTDFNKLFDDYVDHNQDGSLSQEQLASAKTHLASCSVCNASVLSHDEMLTSLRQMPIAGPAEGYEERILHAAKQRNTGQHQRRSFIAGFGSAAAAALALWLVVGGIPKEVSKPTQVASIPEVTMALSQPQHVKVAFRAVKAIQGAKITIQVPENVALVGYPGKRELSWEANLVEGENLLRLPVMATHAMQGQLVARIEHGNRVKTLRINLKTDPKDLSGQGVLIERLV